MNSTALRWLHLTDLHIGKQSQSQEVAIGSLIGAITEAAGEKPFDLVILSGDLVYSGKGEEFSRLGEILIAKLQALPLCKGTKFVAVPGNHDLDCDVGTPLVWSALGSRKDFIFDSDPRGVGLRAHRALAFSKYTEFAKKYEVLTVDPLKSPCEVHLLDVNGRKFRIVCVVTAFFSDKDKELTDKHRAPIPVQPVRAALADLSADETPIIIGHHPADWFLPDSAEHFRTLLIGNKALYLHGHEHSIIQRSANCGLISLGFGAAYQASPEDSTASIYRNSFAICEFSDDLHIAISFWDNENGKWRPETKLPADFAVKSDRLVDGFVLTLPSTLLTTRAATPQSIFASAVRQETHITNCVWLVKNDTKRWTELLMSMGKLTPFATAYKLPRQMMAVGHVQFRIDDGRSHYLVYAICANGDILHQDQIQKINTFLDTEDYDGCFILTLGTLAKEAKTLASQLSLRKPITVLERAEIVRMASRALNLEQRRTLDETESDKVKATSLYTSLKLA